MKGLMMVAGGLGDGSFAVDSVDFFYYFKAKPEFFIFFSANQ
jgi:hypothetical protein